MTVHGRVHRFGDNIDTDVIIPARHLNITTPSGLAEHCMEDIDPDFVSEVRAGDIIVAGKNFGCGSSREHAPMAIKAAGISLVVAQSFARIFYRNAINIGLPILECAQADSIGDGDTLRVSLDSGTVVNETTGETLRTHPFPPYIADIIESGGLLESVLKRNSSPDFG